MPRRNRVDPTGTLHAVPDRGTLWGNRGQLLDAAGDLARDHTGKGWVICLLEFKGWQRVQWQPGRLTELYFLDEATGLAAGHRPCGLCRHADHQAFKAAWGAAHPRTSTRAPAIDAVLHEQRLNAARAQRTHIAPFDGLPDGTMVARDGAPWLVFGDALHRWTFGGYGERCARPRRADATVLTPVGTVAALGAGYRAGIHSSAETG